MSLQRNSQEQGLHLRRKVGQYWFYEQWKPAAMAGASFRIYQAKESQAEELRRALGVDRTGESQ
jgi:hypothetical protein